MEIKRFNWYHEVTRKTLTCRQIYKSIRGTLSSPSLPVFLPEGIPEKLHPSWNPEPGQTGEQGAQLTAPPLVSLLKGYSVSWPELSPEGLLLSKGFIRYILCIPLYTVVFSFSLS